MGVDDMDNWQKKEFLLMYHHAVKAEREAREEYEQLQLDGILLRSPSFDKDSGGGGATVKDLGDHLARIERLMDRDLIPKIRWRLEVHGMITAAIDDLPKENQRLVLRARYLLFVQTDYERKHGLGGTQLRTWRQVGDYCGYSRDSVLKIQRAALRHLRVPAVIADKLSH